MIYLLPYVKHYEYDKLCAYPVYQRPELGKPSSTKFFTPKVWKATNFKWRHNWAPYTNFSTAEEAMADLDKQLSKGKFYLIKEDEVERFTKKLAVLL